MIINVEKNNDSVVLKIEGRLDTMTAAQLENEINKISEDVKHLVIDMAKLEYISSAGLRVILAAQKKMAKVGSMKVLSVSEAVMEVFEITGFADVLTIE